MTFNDMNKIEARLEQCRALLRSTLSQESEALDELQQNGDADRHAELEMLLDDLAYFRAYLKGQIESLLSELNTLEAA